jgi:formate hydrogenlyase subunit 4
LILAPLLLGLINRTKAWAAGRRGQPLFQAYFDIWKLLQKGAVYSTAATPVVWLGPVIALAAVASAVVLVPVGAVPAAVAFQGDLLVVAGLLGLARLCIVLSALDTASSFEGMGASREVMLAALAEPAVLLALATLATVGQSLSLSTALAGLPGSWLGPGGPVLLLTAAALALALLAENARIPVDDPNTHLELTMVHEVMVLDHSGPDLAFIHYAAALKLWLFTALLAAILFPLRNGVALSALAHLGGIAVVAVGVGVVESSTARLRMMQAPNLLVVAVTLAALGAGLAVLA